MLVALMPKIGFERRRCGNMKPPKNKNPSSKSPGGPAVSLPMIPPNAGCHQASNAGRTSRAQSIGQEKKTYIIRVQMAAPAGAHCAGAWK